MSEFKTNILDSQGNPVSFLGEKDEKVIKEIVEKIARYDRVMEENEILKQDLAGSINSLLVLTKRAGGVIKIDNDEIQDIPPNERLIIENNPEFPGGLFFKVHKEETN